MINIFIGFDPRESIAFHVLSHSISTRSSCPVSIAPLILSQLKGVLRRDRDHLQSTDFSFSRFLVPYLSGFQGWSLYMDCDMLCLEDINLLWQTRDEKMALMTVKHDYTPPESHKFLGQVQTNYARKNWSSLMLFNNALCSQLSPNYINSASGLDLHQFAWLKDDKIGSLDPKWNHLVGYGASEEDVAIAHFTKGGPYFQDYRFGNLAELWYTELAALLSTAEGTLYLNHLGANKK